MFPSGAYGEPGNILKIVSLHDWYHDSKSRVVRTTLALGYCFICCSQHMLEGLSTDDM